MASEQITESVLDNVTAGLDHFDPFQGFVDDGKKLNIRHGFRLGKINFLINENTMCEVVKKPLIYPVPNTPSWIQGLINLHGVLVPVFDIKKRIEQQHSDDKKNDVLLVVDKGERAFAIFIDALPDSINLDDNDFTKISTPDDIPEILKKHITETVRLDQEVWLELNYDSFIKHVTRDYSSFQADE